MRKFILIILIFSFNDSFIHCFGQNQNKPILKFQKDSVLIGEPTPVSFSFRHKPEQEVVFPDSTFDFSPFEYEYREVFTTVTDSLSTDSCVYYLSTFEIDKIQRLKLPAFVYTQKDSIPVFSDYDTIILTEVIPIISDTLKIKENADFQEVKTNFNTLLFSLIAGALIVIFAVFGFLFRKKIVRFFKARKLKKAHEKFLSDLIMALNNIIPMLIMHI